MAVPSKAIDSTTGPPGRPAAGRRRPCADDQAPTQAGEGAPGAGVTTRRGFLKLILGGAAAPMAAGVYTREIEPFWVEYHDVPMPIRGLHPALEGMRMAHLTDLHASDIVPFSYLERVVARVKAGRPDAVFITGDLSTDARQEWFDPIVNLLTGFACPTYVTLGNHDYGSYYPTTGDKPEWKWSPDVLEEKLRRRGAFVLRNRAVVLQPPRGRALPAARPDGWVWVVGLGDLWGGDFSPGHPEAFAKVPSDAPIIALSHNPDTAPKLGDPYAPQWVLAGHTHGGQVRVPFLGAPILPVMHKEFDQGLFQLHYGRMYISRGVGFLKRVRFLCRPEVPTFVLRRA